MASFGWVRRISTPRSCRSEGSASKASGSIRAPLRWASSVDWQVGQTSGPYVKPPQHIVSLRERRWKIAEYYDANGKVPSQWEMYDLKHDPLERKNLAHKGHRRTPAQEKQYLRLQRKLARVKANRLRPLSNTPEPQTTGDPSRSAPVSAMD